MTDIIDRTILRLTSERRDLLEEVIYLRQLRLKDAEDHEEAMRILIKILSKRCDIIRNLSTKASNWRKVAIKANRKILESRIRQVKPSFGRFRSIEV